jgi:hypothetical protein
MFMCENGAAGTSTQIRKRTWLAGTTPPWVELSSKKGEVDSIIAAW